MNEWKLNPVWGRVFSIFLTRKRYAELKVPEKLLPREIRSILRELRNHPCEESMFFEGRITSVSRDSAYGCLLMGFEQTNGEPGFYVAVICEQSPDRWAYFTVLPDGAEGRGRLSILLPHGWHDLTSRRIREMPEGRMAVTALADHVRNTGTHEVEPWTLVARPGTIPPMDSHCRDRIVQALKGKLKVTEGLVALSNIRPFSIDCCLGMQNGLVEPFSKRVARGDGPSILLYWDGDSFVMSDDYPVYLAYRKLRTANVRAVIMGEFPNDLVRQRITGGGPN